MMYFLFGPPVRDEVKAAHSAMADVLMCRKILIKIVERLGVETYDELWKASEAARTPKAMPFGKHKGVAIADVPLDYVQWLLKQNDVDPYLRREFEKR